MQTIAANLGGMLTPFEIRRICICMVNFRYRIWNLFLPCFLPFLYSIILITITCLIFVKSTPMKLSQANSEKLDGKRRH